MDRVLYRKDSISRFPTSNLHPHPHSRLHLDSIADDSSLSLHLLPSIPKLSPLHVFTPTPSSSNSPQLFPRILTETSQIHEAEVELDSGRGYSSAIRSHLNASFVSHHESELNSNLNNSDRSSQVSGFNFNTTSAPSSPRKSRPHSAPSRNRVSSLGGCCSMKDFSSDVLEDSLSTPALTPDNSPILKKRGLRDSLGELEGRNRVDPFGYDGAREGEMDSFRPRSNTWNTMGGKTQVSWNGDDDGNLKGRNKLCPPPTNQRNASIRSNESILTLGPSPRSSTSPTRKRGSIPLPRVEILDRLGRSSSRLEKQPSVEFEPPEVPEKEGPGGEKLVMKGTIHSHPFGGGFQRSKRQQDDELSDEDEDLFLPIPRGAIGSSLGLSLGPASSQAQTQRNKMLQGVVERDGRQSFLTNSKSEIEILFTNSSSSLERRTQFSDQEDHHYLKKEKTQDSTSLDQISLNPLPSPISNPEINPFPSRAASKSMNQFTNQRSHFQKPEKDSLQTRSKPQKRPATAQALMNQSFFSPESSSPLSLELKRAQLDQLQHGFQSPSQSPYSSPASFNPRLHLQRHPSSGSRFNKIKSPVTTATSETTPTFLPSSAWSSSQLLEANSRNSSYRKSLRKSDSAPSLNEAIGMKLNGNVDAQKGSRYHFKNAVEAEEEEEEVFEIKKMGTGNGKVRLNKINPAPSLPHEGGGLSFAENRGGTESRGGSLDGGMGFRITNSDRCLDHQGSNRMNPLASTFRGLEGFNSSTSRPILGRAKILHTSSNLNPNSSRLFNSNSNANQTMKRDEAAFTLFHDPKKKEVATSPFSEEQINFGLELNRQVETFAIRSSNIEGGMGGEIEVLKENDDGGDFQRNPKQNQEESSRNQDENSDSDFGQDSSDNDSISAAEPQRNQFDHSRNQSPFHRSNPSISGGDISQVILSLSRPTSSSNHNHGDSSNSVRKDSTASRDFRSKGSSSPLPFYSSFEGGREGKVDEELRGEGPSMERDDSGIGGDGGKGEGCSGREGWNDEYGDSESGMEEEWLEDENQLGEHENEVVSLGIAY